MKTEVLAGPERRRRWSAAEKAQVVAEVLAPGANVTAIARRCGISRSLLYAWRSEARPEPIVPVVPSLVPVIVASGDGAGTASKRPARQIARTGPVHRHHGTRTGVIEIALAGEVRVTPLTLNKGALSVQFNMKADLREIYGAPTRAAAKAAIEVFADKCGAKYDKAVVCLTKDREALLAFFDFPAEHWDHLRTSNPIESVFATVRHRTVRTKEALSAKTAKLMVFKLVSAAAKTWRRLNREDQLPKVVQGIKFQNGIEVIKMPAHHAA